MKSVPIDFFTIWLISMAIGTIAQPEVLDTTGQHVQTDVEYYILPGITGVAGALTLIDRNNSCPLYVGQDPITVKITERLPVKFKPYADGETMIKESTDLNVTFQAFTICIQSTAWRVGEIGRRFILTAGRPDYFKIENNGRGDYNFVYCPTESCPNCKPRCGSVGIFIENGKRLLVLDGPAFPFRFERVN
ncbi:kunitz type trypsin inhibitor 104 [Jatropha curcas]|uniref:kunitz type trypsin inhibitor 104 n=1 Tax=Jatropha curcas TaxID=180498 RepID=UPI00189356EC|nr:kunitz type trypsin inhibitor 104 [Jatropha curcas]